MWTLQINQNYALVLQLIREGPVSFLYSTTTNIYIYFCLRLYSATISFFTSYTVGTKAKTPNLEVGGRPSGHLSWPVGSNTTTFDSYVTQFFYISLLYYKKFPHVTYLIMVMFISKKKIMVMLIDVWTCYSILWFCYLKCLLLPHVVIIMCIVTFLYLCYLKFVHVTHFMVTWKFYFGTPDYAALDLFHIVTHFCGYICQLDFFTLSRTTSV